jgi:hypothetical protein
MPTLYVRTTDALHEFVTQCAQESGVSASEVVNVLLDAARRRGWTITRTTVQVREPE